MHVAERNCCCVHQEDTCSYSVHLFNTSIVKPTLIALETLSWLVAGEAVRAAMAAAFVKDGKLEVNSSAVVRLDPEGAKFI